MSGLDREKEHQHHSSEAEKGKSPSDEWTKIWGYDNHAVGKPRCYLLCDEGGLALHVIVSVPEAGVGSHKG